MVPLHAGAGHRSGGRPSDQAPPGSGAPRGPGDFSIGEQVADFGVPPHLLRDHQRNAALEPSLVDGRISALDGESQKVQYLRQAARRRPGGRLIVLARPEPKPPVEELFRSVLGLGLGLAVVVRSRQRRYRSAAPAVHSWRIGVSGPGRSEARFGSAQPSLPAAVQQLQNGLDLGLRQALEIGRLASLPVPQQPVPVRVDLQAIELGLECLGASYPDAEIRVAVDLASCSCHLGPPHDRSASAPTPLEAVFGLLAVDLVEPGQADLRRKLDLVLDENAGEGP